MSSGVTFFNNVSSKLKYNTNAYKVDMSYIGWMYLFFSLSSTVFVWILMWISSRVVRILFYNISTVKKRMENDLWYYLSVNHLYKIPITSPNIRKKTEILCKYILLLSDHRDCRPCLISTKGSVCLGCNNPPILTLKYKVKVTKNQSGQCDEVKMRLKKWKLTVFNCRWPFTFGFSCS